MTTPPAQTGNTALQHFITIERETFLQLPYSGHKAGATQRSASRRLSAQRRMCGVSFIPWVQRQPLFLQTRAFHRAALGRRGCKIVDLK
jgi:hypothetical protein